MNIYVLFGYFLKSVLYNAEQNMTITKEHFAAGQITLCGGPNEGPGPQFGDPCPKI